MFSHVYHSISQGSLLKVEYDANENPSKNSEKIAYFSQRLIYPIQIKETLPL